MSLLAGPWFHDVMSTAGPAPFYDAQEYRHRHIIKALSRKTTP